MADRVGHIQKLKPMWKMPTLFTSFIGREQDVVDICALLKQPEVRLLTLLGPGGIGKTRLSVQVATEMRGFFVDGVCFVHLAAIYDPKLVISAIAEELEIREIGAQSLIEQVKLLLQDKHFLLVLDNFEQVAEAVPQVEELLVACPFLKILVTSRVVLHVQGEQEFPVSPLALPNLRQLPEDESLAQISAIVLFVQRARTMLPSFQLNPTNARTIAEICVRLDGLPLAIELAVARIKLLPPQALLSRLSQRLQVLTGGTRARPERQQTLRNTFKWSYDLLDAHEQQFFRRLSVFVGGWTLEAAEAVVGRTIQRANFSVLDGIASLLDKSLLIQFEREGEEPYLNMLETIREYGMECLVESGEAEAFQQAHALYYLAWVEEAEPHLKDAQQLAWLTRLEHEQENLRTALQWFIDHQETEQALRFCGAIWRFWYIHSYWSEGLRWLKEALAYTEERTAERAKVLLGSGTLSFCLGDTAIGHALIEESVALYRELGDIRGLAESLAVLGGNSLNDPLAARTLLEESIAMARQAKDRWTLALSLQSLGDIKLFQDNLEEALPLLQESADLFREGGDKRMLIFTLQGLIHMATLQGEYERAASFAQENLAQAQELGDKHAIADVLYALSVVASFRDEYPHAVALAQKSLALAQELGDKNGIARGLAALGELYLDEGRLLQATSQLEESLKLYQELDSKYNIAINLLHLGNIKRLREDRTQAKVLYMESLLLAREIGSKQIISDNLVGFGKVAIEEGQSRRAAHLFGTAEIWFDLSKLMVPAEYEDYQRAVEKVRAKLGKEAFLTAWNKGKTMSLEQVLAAQEQDFIIEQISATTSPSVVEESPTTPTYSNDLTAREVEVLRLIARGWTDAQIAKQMVISPRTVNTHLTSIYRKIRVSSRSAATRYAIDNKLI